MNSDGFLMRGTIILNALGFVETRFGQLNLCARVNLLH